MRFIFLLLIVVGGEAQAWDFFEPSCQPDRNSCEVYKCVSNSLQCDRTNYLTSFGLHYCNKFIELNRKFSRRGRVTLANIRECLQQRLVAESDLTCGNVRLAAVDHHVSCYTEMGFCEMSFFDQYRIFLVVGKSLQEPDYKKTMRQIQKICRKRNSLLLEN